MYSYSRLLPLFLALPLAPFFIYLVSFFLLTSSSYYCYKNHLWLVILDTAQNEKHSHLPENKYLYPAVCALHSVHWGKYSSWAFPGPALVQLLLFFPVSFFHYMIVHHYRDCQIVEDPITYAWNPLYIVPDGNSWGR